MAPMDVLPRWRHIQARIAMAGKPYEEQIIWRSIFESPLEEKPKDGAG